MNALQVHQVCKQFKNDPVLSDVSLNVPSGSTVVLFGPSGAGKTVLLRLIAGVIEPDSGSIAIQGEDMAGVEPEDRGIGMAFQNFALFPHKSAFDNIASPLHAQAMTHNSVDRAVNAVAKLLKIDHVLNHSPGALSNGQKQRTALARALAAEPKLLLLDDPLRNVDAKLRFEMRMELPRLMAAQGATVVYVTQDYKEAMAIGDRIIVLDRGRVIQNAIPEDIYLRPANLTIAQLFGDPTINQLPVTPRTDASGVFVEIGSARLDLSAEIGGSEIIGQPCILGLRPESLHFSEGDLGPTIAVEIEAETPLNEKVVTLVVTADGHEILASRPAHLPGPMGRKAHLGLSDVGAAMLFDAKSGVRIGSGLRDSAKKPMAEGSR